MYGGKSRSFVRRDRRRVRVALKSLKADPRATVRISIEVVCISVVVGSQRRPRGGVLPRFVAVIDRGGGGGRRIRGAGRRTCQFLCGFITRLAGGGNLLKPALSKTGSRSLTLCPVPIDASSIHLQWRNTWKGFSLFFFFLKESFPPNARKPFVFYWQCSIKDITTK